MHSWWSLKPKQRFAHLCVTSRRRKELSHKLDGCRKIIKMQKLWEKTKKGVTLGLNTAMTFTGIKEEDEVPEFLERKNQLETMQSNAKALVQLFEGLGTCTQKLASTTKVCADVLSESFTEADSPYYENATTTKSVAESCQQNADTLAQAKFPTYCIGPLNDLLQQIEQLKKIMDKRRKNRVLMQSQKKNPEQAAVREAKYNRYHTAFINGVDTLESKRAAVFGGVFNAYQYYMQDLIRSTKSQITASMEAFPYQAVQAPIPAITAAPPTAQ